MRALYDSTDFANEVFKSLVAKSDQFEFESFEALTAHLVHAAKQKVIDEYRRQHRRRRDLRRRLHFGAIHEEGAPFEPPSSSPTASQIAEARETRARLVEVSDEARTVIELKEQNFTNAEAAERTGLPVRTVQRLLKRMREALARTGSAL
jgi:RNA polymerase sigma factor (sigma-70 family)